MLGGAAARPTYGLEVSAGTTRPKFCWVAEDPFTGERLTCEHEHVSPGQANYCLKKARAAAHGSLQGVALQAAVVVEVGSERESALAE